MAEILVVDDEHAIRQGLAHVLSTAGHAVREAADGEAACAAVSRRRPDLVLLDVMMPGMDGLATCRALRADDPELPILFLTALDDTDSTLRGFGVGADDYLPKTTPSDVMLAKIAVALRRTGVMPRAETFRFGAAVVDPEALSLTRPDGTVATLTEREVALLRLLVVQRGLALTAEGLIGRLWPEGDVGETALRQLVHRLREKLGPDAVHMKPVRPGMLRYE